MIDLLRTRRSIRTYQDRPLEPAQVETLTEALLRSPTSRNLRPWEFVLVEDRAMLRQLATAKPHGAAFLGGAALGIVICGDERTSDVWVEDCSIAAILVQLTAQSLGLGSCWAQIRKRPHDDSRTAEQHVQELLGIPAHLRVECIIGVGHPAETRDPVPAAKLERHKVHRERYG